MSYNHFPRQRAKDKMFEMSFHMIRVGGRGLYSFRPKEKWKFARKVLFGPHFTCKDVMHRAESAETIKTVLRDVSHVQCPKFKFRFVFFPFQCCVIQLSVDRFGNNFGGLRTLGQVRISQSFCSFGPQRAEKRNN